MTDSAGEKFSASAQKLCGQCAVALGWRPDEFWGSTPSELACVLRALMPESNDPVDSNATAQLMRMYPDAPTGDE